MCFGGGDDPEEQESRLALAEQAATMLRSYGDTFFQLENQEIDAARRQFDPVNYERSVAAGMQQAAQAYEPAILDQQRAAGARGLDPGSGAFMSESEALRGAQARAMGLAGADRAITNTDQGFNRLQNVVAMGQGVQSDAFQGSMDIADRASQRIRSAAEDDFRRSSSLQSALGNVAGGVTAFGLRGRYT